MRDGNRIKAKGYKAQPSNHMTSANDYKQLLQRLRAGLPQTQAKSDWFEVPKAELKILGRKTSLENFGDICELFQRKPQQLYVYLTKKLGTAGNLEDHKLIFNSIISQTQIDSALETYYQDYVKCPVCGRPDTTLVKKGRVTYIKCMACGAESPVKSELR